MVRGTEEVKGDGERDRGGHGKSKEVIGVIGDGDRN